MKRKNDNSGKPSQSKKTTSPAPKSKSKTLNDLIDENYKLAEESLRRANECHKETEKFRGAVTKHRETVLITHLAEIINDPLNNQQEIERIFSELEKMYGIDPAPKPNHCKTCIFQKMCSDFTADGRNGLTCSFASYNNKILDLLREEDHGIVYDKKLIFWNDTQEQLDARFILS